jgi:hypothetical protein
VIEGSEHERPEGSEGLSGEMALSTDAPPKARPLLGMAVLAAGLVMIPFPGPGWLVVVIGLNLIKPDNPIAPWIRRRIPGIPNEGAIPRYQIALGAVAFVVMTAAGTTLSLLYGDQVMAWLRSTVGLG